MSIYIETCENDEKCDGTIIGAYYVDGKIMSAAEGDSAFIEEWCALFKCEVINCG